MLFMIALVVGYGATWLIPPRSRWTPQKRWRYALAAGMVVFGALHLITPTPFLQHIPPWAPAREALVIVSGLIEIAFGVALVLPTTLRPWIGYALAAYLVAVFPGNIYVAVAGIDVAGQPDGAYPWIRLAFQPLFIWLAVWTTRPTGSSQAGTSHPSVVSVTDHDAHEPERGAGVH